MRNGLKVVENFNVKGALRSVPQFLATVRMVNDNVLE